MWVYRFTGPDPYHVDCYDCSNLTLHPLISRFLLLHRGASIFTHRSVQNFMLPNISACLMSDITVLLIPRLAKGIKHLIKESRPIPPPPPSGLSRASKVRPKYTYGMPSTHSTALTFYLVYLLPIIPSLYALPSQSHLYSQSRIFPRMQDISNFLPCSPGLISQGFLLGYWVLGLWSRVELGYHTPQQVLGGIVLGCVLALGWRNLWLATPNLERWVQGVIDHIWSRTFGRIFS